MISAEQWWSIIEAYGAQIWPAQVVFYVIAFLLIGWLLLKPSQVHSLFMKLYLTIAFAWNGIAFFLVFAKEITGAGYGSYFFGFLFILVSVLFLVDLFRKKMLFSFPNTTWRKYVTIGMMLLTFCYPLFGIAFGRSYLSLISPGTFPCPTTSLGLLVLTTSLPRVNKIAYILLLFWAVPFPPFLQLPKYGVYEDTIMLASGIYSLILLFRYWRVKDTNG